MDKERGIKRYVVLNADLFKKCLMSVAANSDYSDWLVGRQIGERDRSPCYARLRSIFTDRLRNEMHTNAIKFPQPHWMSS
jgi:hypothetical protein